MQWKTITCRRYQKLIKYLHVYYQANEPAKTVQNKTKWTRFYSAKHDMSQLYWELHAWKKIRQLMKVWVPTDLAMYNIYLPSQSRQELRHGCAVMLIQHICINFMHILINSKTLEFGLGYDVVMNLCKDIFGKNQHVYCDNLFTSVQLWKGLLVCRTCYNLSIWVNRKYLPDGIHKSVWMIWGAYKSYQDVNSNLVATVW